MVKLRGEPWLYAVRELPPHFGPKSRRNPRCFISPTGVAATKPKRSSFTTKPGTPCSIYNCNISLPRPWGNTRARADQLLRKTFAGTTVPAPLPLGFSGLLSKGALPAGVASRCPVVLLQPALQQGKVVN